KGCAGVALRWARLPPTRSRAWLPESARECTDSASIDEELLKRNATNFATAIARLAARAATIALVPPDALMCPRGPFVRRVRAPDGRGCAPVRKRSRRVTVRHCCSPAGYGASGAAHAGVRRRRWPGTGFRRRSLRPSPRPGRTRTCPG